MLFNVILKVFGSSCKPLRITPRLLLFVLIVLGVLAAEPLVLLLSPVVEKISGENRREDAKELRLDAPESVGESLGEDVREGSLLVRR